MYSEYTPRKVRIKGAHPHPTALVEPTAMAAVEPVDPTYKPKLPRSMIEEGKISATGIENVVYAGQAHTKVLPSGERMGYFIGDGTGVGKGRQIGAIIMDNWNQGRRKALWVSKSAGLINDAKRDLIDLGFNVERLINFQKNQGRLLEKATEGVAFVPYSSLAKNNPGLNMDGQLQPPGQRDGKVQKTRMHRLYDWLGPDFDGVIVFDEAHQAGNAIDLPGKRGVKHASQTGRAVLDVQRLFPQARVVYSSATGATDVTNLGYADRLGIWGAGTPFATKEAFFNEIKAGGLSAMEIVARDLKALGRYLARTLSFEGVTHRQLVHRLTPEQNGIYDELARAWQYVLRHRNETMAATGAARNGRARSAANSAFYGAQQRFYNQLLTAMQMPSVIQDMRAELAKGKSLVLQLVNTDEAAQQRQVARKKTEAVEGEADWEDLDLSPRDILLQYIHNSYPVDLYEAVTDANGNTSWQPVRDAAGNPVPDPAAIARRQELEDQVALLKVPSSPIEMVLDTFGAQNVAEITGRSQRFVLKEQKDGTMKRGPEKRKPAHRKVEADEFQEGKRRILLFSDAGGTGFSYHASRRAKNQQRRAHYLVQAGWRADAALQGFGRTHRADQVSAPEYVLVSTDIKGHQRFISTIARRLSELGALTGGERKAAGGEMFSELSNLENDYAEDAVDALFMDMHHGRAPGLEFHDVVQKLGFTKTVMDQRTGELTEINTLLDENGRLMTSKLPPIQQFLNRILSLEVPEQNRVFDAFVERMENRIEQAKADGSYDPGLQTLKALAIRKLGDEQVFQDPDTSAATRLVTLEHDHARKITPWEELGRGTAVAEYVRNNRSGRVYALKPGPPRTRESGAVVDTWRRIHPAGYEIVDRSEVGENYTRLEEAQAQARWDQEVAALPKVRTEKDTYVVGTFLPIWDRLKIPDPKVWRLTTEGGETFLGVRVPPHSLAGLRRRLGAGAGGQRAAGEVFTSVLDRGEPVDLANGWMLRRVRVSGENRIEVLGVEYSQQREFTEHIGGFMERIGYRPRFFLPTDETAGPEAMEKLLRKSPTVGDQAEHDMAVAEAGEAREAEREAEREAGVAEAARELMRERFAGIRRRGGDLASEHIERVAAKMTDPVLKAIAYLHDIVEDTPTTLTEIRQRFGARIADAIDAETWRKAEGETYEHYIERLSRNPDAILSKLGDIEDNLEASKGWGDSPLVKEKVERWTKQKERLERMLAGLPDLTPTIERKYMPGGRLREEWRAEQVRKVVNLAGHPPKGQQKTIIFSGGGAGAGKSTLIELEKREGWVPPRIDVTISADDYKMGDKTVKRAQAEGIPEMWELHAAGVPLASKYVHKESTTMAKATLKLVREEGREAIYDATMSDHETDWALAEAAKKLGYDVEMMGVWVEPEEAVRRAEIRAKKEHREVDADVVRDGARLFAKSFPEYLERFDRVRLWDNNRDRDPHLVLEKSEKGLVIHEPEAYIRYAGREAYERAAKLQRKGTPGASSPARWASRSDGRDSGRTGRRSGGGAAPVSGEIREGNAGDSLAGVTEHSMAGGTRTLPQRVSRAPRNLAPSTTTPTSEAANAFLKDVNWVRAGVAPQTLGEPARFTADLLRMLHAQMANEMARADAALRPMRRDFDRTPVPKRWKYDPTQPLPRNLAFIDAYEGGRMDTLTAKEAEVAEQMRRLNEEWVDRVRALGTGKLQALVANYFPHIWDNPTRARQVLAAALGKRPLEGSRSFLKQRVYQLFRDGLEAGLKPVHDNPVDLFLLKKREVERYILGQRFIEELKAVGLAKFVHAFHRAPAGWRRVDDRVFEVYGPPTVAIKEAFDAGMRAKTLELLEDLGVPHERRARIGGRRWGYEREETGKPGTERIVTKFGGPDFVIWHELGHALDNRYRDLREAVMGPEAEQHQVAVHRLRRTPVPVALERTARLGDELRALADLRFEGLKPTDNFRRAVRTTPEKMAVVLQAYVHAPERMRQVAPTVHDAFQKFLANHPELAKVDEIKPGLALGEAEAEMTVGGLIKLGNYYLPDAAARVVQNYLSPGLNPHLWYRTVRETSHLINAAQLGLSAFHLGFTSIDAAVSRLAAAFEDLAHGDWGRAVRTVASVPAAPVTNIRLGAKVRAEVLKPGTQGPDIAEVVKALEAGGGRVGQDAFWQMEFSRRLARAFREGSLSGYVRGVVQLPMAMLEQVMRPVMEYIVPRQKLGVFADLARRELEWLGPSAAPEDVRAAMRKVWDSVDNRMGQVVYDNLFYNRAVKDLALIAFRAYGWQLGKYREIGGAAWDVAQQARAVARGQKPELTHRMAYALALPVLVGALGALTQYLMTGRRPEDWRDYFMPRTGELDDKGREVRLSLPSYLKDLISMSKHPVTTVGHALNPLLAVVADMLQNKDFYDVRIFNPDDPLPKRMQDAGLYLGKAFTPFSVSGAMKLAEDAAPLHKQVLPFFGVVPAPQRNIMSPAEAFFAEAMSAGMPKRPRTREQFDRSKLIRELVQDLNARRLGEFGERYRAGVKAGLLNEGAVRTMIERLGWSPLQFQAMHVDPETAMRGWRLASPAEQMQLRQVLAQRIANSQTVKPEDQRAWLKELGYVERN